MSGMYQEIMAFVLTISGWILESSTVSMDFWKVSSDDGSVITTSTFWANLWKHCVTDSTGISSCRDFPSMLALDGYIQACRGLMIAAICLGLFGSVLALVGMKCTKVGGSDENKARITCFAGVDFILCGICSLSACSLYAHRITTEFFDPMFMSQKYELGAALFIGWAGGILCILGGSVFCLSVADSFSRSHSQANYIYRGAASHSHITAYTRGQTKPVKEGHAADNSSSSRVQHFDKNAYV
ncbi:claudin-10-like isoform X1 [Xiphophorus couchianus]|uniref:claudin-10-like isoform X1 n=1 Tax=Xiphophorus couchianus TaxID=32473 RepID=UPI001016358A|nr:claudin-10-like isoform X1 [Xiphophorus couchianus]XP_032422629.1 claudin-10 isoform X1 [Xiphophorus hellerii]